MTLDQHIYWNALGTAGLEHLDLTEAINGIVAESLVIRHHERSGLHMQYRILADEEWRTREVEVGIVGAEKKLHFFADGEGNWWDADKKPLDDLKGCLDVDVQATPFTNTLAIRRLELAVGKKAILDVAYVVIPEITVRRGKQRYTRLKGTKGKTQYLYESLDNDFKAKLSVDKDGLVVDYEGIWKRVNV